MSWQATAWAATTRGHRSHGTKLVLLVLANYHNAESDLAWPSQKTLSEVCEMPVRTVQWCLRHLEKAGFITKIRKGNQYQPSTYRMNFDVVDVAGAQGYEPAISEPASIAPSSEPARNDKVNPQDDASEPASLLKKNRQEPLEEESLLNIHRWVEILSEDSRWPQKLSKGFVEDLEESFKGIDLTLEARKCLAWLQETTKGKKKILLTRTWLNWLDGKKNGRSPQYGGTSEDQRTAQRGYGGGSRDGSSLEEIEAEKRRFGQV